MMYFANVTTLEELKKAYRELALENHPDRGGNVEIMQEINNQYAAMFEKVKDIHTNKDGEQFTRTTNEAPQDFINIINELLKMDGITIEVIGCFIWITGNTKPHKEELKGLGFKWHSKKLCWYKAPEDYRRFGKKEYTLDDIRHMYQTKYKNTGKKEKEEKFQIAWAF